jgi:uncharacterized cysteine cluster protein YcgN (CxxCxxCC family)
LINSSIKGIINGAMDEELYLRKQEEQMAENESRCVRCGECCGSRGDDPCSNLEKDGYGSYYCKAYLNRLGPQKTALGKAFNCVLIRDVVRFDPPYSNCPYIRGAQ